ncbi:DNA polymerase III subunit gamma/tau [Marinomonas epiphytica]
MSYQVLARKWRPQTFLEMAGQDHVLQALVNALRQQRLHHAYLFTGTRGVGKTTIARIFAKCLNCETNGISPEPCGTCDSCVEIAEGRFVDLIEVDAASRTKVEDTRELLENVQYAPTRGRFKVYLIDEVHMLSSHSFNALLKTLEEPPEHVKFLLATTDPQKLPVTILSRCLQFNLKNMSAQRVVDYLQTVLNSETVGYEQSALWQIGQAANGSMRDALSLTDQAIAFGDGSISESGVTAMLGLVNQSQILDLLETIASKDAALTLQKIQSLADYQPNYVALCGSLLDCLHRVAIEQQVPGALQDQLGDLPRIQNIAQQVRAEEIQLMYQSLLIGRRDLPLAHSMKSGFEMLMLRLIAFRPAPPMTVSHAAPPSQEVVSTENQSPIVHEPQEPEAQAPVTEPQLSAPEMSTPDREETVIEPSNQPLQAESAESSDTAHGSVEATEAELESAQDASSRPPWEEPDETPEPFVESKLPTEQAFQEQDVQEQDSQKKKDEPQQSPAPKEVSETLEKMVEAKRAASVYDDALVNDDDEEEDEEEAEERAIADVADPFNPAADLVESLGQTDTDTPKEESEPKGPVDSRLAKIPDHIAQPALALPVPDMSHFNELSMKIWWLVAPRLALTGLVHNIIMNSSLQEASDQGIRIQVPLEYGHMLNQTRYEQVQSALSDFFDQPVPLIIDTVEEVNGVTAEEFAASKRAEALQSAIDYLNSHPVVQALTTTMNAQLIYDTVKVKA